MVEFGNLDALTEEEWDKVTIVRHLTLRSADFIPSVGLST